MSNTYNRSKQIAKILSLLLAVLIADFWEYSPATAQTPGSWTATGSMITARSNATTTLLSNGKVLVAGGASISNTITSTAELYNPSTGTWEATGSMNTPRLDHTATLLPDGRVLVAGGQIQSCLTTSSAELYDPITGTWSATASMQSSRSRHFAVLIVSGLLSGKVLVAGGYINSNDGGCGGDAALASSELYDPTIGTWSSTNNMKSDRQSPLGVVLPNSSVLAVGVLNCCPYTWLNNAETYNTETQLWTQTNSKATTANGAAVLLQNNKVLVAGGTSGTQPSSFNVTSAELYDPSTGIWTATGSMFTARGEHTHTLTLLSNGQVMAAGGLSGGWAVCIEVLGAELYDPSNGTWTQTGNMTVPRFGHTAILLPNGQLLVAGGRDLVSGGSCTSTSLSSAELYSPATSSCSIPTNLSSTNITTSTAKLNWNAINNAIFYKISFKKTGTSEWKTIKTLNNNKTLHELAPNTEYTWKVKSLCSLQPNVASDWSEKLFFTTAPFRLTNESGEPSIAVYPNPLISSATILFDLTEASSVTMELMDVNGRIVAVIANQDFPAGNHEINFDRGALAAGIYFLQMKTGEGVMMKKLILE